MIFNSGIWSDQEARHAIRVGIRKEILQSLGITEEAYQSQSVYRKTVDILVEQRMREMRKRNWFSAWIESIGGFHFYSDGRPSSSESRTGMRARLVILVLVVLFFFLFRGGTGMMDLFQGDHLVGDVCRLILAFFIASIVGERLSRVIAKN